MVVTEDSVCVISNCSHMRRIKVDGKVYYCCSYLKEACASDPNFDSTLSVHKITECNNKGRR